MNSISRELCPTPRPDRRRPVWRSSFLVVASLAVAQAQTVPARAQVNDPSLDNLRHPPGTVTAPLGQLGRVDRVGTGPVPVILIPGAAFGGSIWKGFMERNRDAYTMFAITPAGYEGTNPPPWPEGNDFADGAWTKALCTSVVKLIDDEKLDRPVIVGHHMLGDHYAMRIALDHPGKVRGVVVIAGMPSMALGLDGPRTPGEPAKPATLEQRRRMVHSFFVPFYKTVTEKMWRAGSYQARRLCRDTTRGAELFDQQVSVPIPTQLRYFFEYETADLEPELSSLAVPLLAVLPKREWTLDVSLDDYREANEMMYGSLDKAKAAWTSNLSSRWGDVQTGVQWSYDWGFRWERLRGVIPRMTVRYVPDTGIFIMEDQPEALDQALRSFIAGL